MYNQDLEQFQNLNATVTLLVEALKLQDKNLVQICEKTLNNLVDSEEATRILNAAVSQLRNTYPEIYDWTARNFPSFQLCKDLEEQIYMFAVQKLMNNGFILGKDFSTNMNGTILVRRDVKVSLMLLCVRSEWKLIKSIVEIADS
ncbi:hypothetical protein CAL7716_057730 [Calothrix sp. PCC 7716]|nr:hypothetical protein CAL7716_057730 [Calothrix sp. PCC 7716]